MKPVVMVEVRPKAIRRVVAFARDPANHFVVGRTQGPPGDDPRYVVRMGQLRVVYTITLFPGLPITRDGRPLYHHLSASIHPALRVPPDIFPSLNTVKAILPSFGMSPYEDDWEAAGLNREEECGVIVQAWDPGN